MALMVNEIFRSVQGEGLHTGLPTVFVRLAGCDLRCRWCDTPYALDSKEGTPLEISEILEEIRKTGLELVCITGGEPLIQEETPDLVRTLISDGFRVDVETNGASDISVLPLQSESLLISIDVKTPSSGESRSFLLSNLKKLGKSDQIKFIIEDKEDLDFTFSFLEETPPPCNVILTPCSNKGGEMISKRLLDNLNNTQIRPLREVLKRTRLMIQTHKVLWDPDQRAV